MLRACPSAPAVLASALSCSAGCVCQERTQARTAALEKCLPEGVAWLCHHSTQIHGMGKHTQGGFTGWI